jgi:hypothetical protein
MSKFCCVYESSAKEALNILRLVIPQRDTNGVFDHSPISTESFGSYDMNIYTKYLAII